MIHVMGGDDQAVGVRESDKRSGIRATGKRTVDGRAGFWKFAA